MATDGTDSSNIRHWSSGLEGIWMTTIILGVLTFVLRGLFRIFLHPLSHIPGPRLAAISNIWLVINEYVRSQNFTDILKVLHAHYGPVVRYSPNCVHFATPQAYWDIYSRTSKWNKDAHFYNATGDTVSSFGLTSYQQAKARKDVVSGFFSRRSVLAMQDIMTEQVNILISQLISGNHIIQPVDLTMSLRSLTQDVITKACLGVSSGTLQIPCFKSPQIQAIDDNLSTFVFFKSFPLIRWITYNTPLAAWVPGEVELGNLEHFVVLTVQDAIRHPENVPRGCMIAYLLDYNRRASYQLDSQQLIEEVGAFVAGGGETVAVGLITGFHYLMQQPKLYQELLSELRGIWPQPNSSVPDLDELEKLPLLSAFIKELLRFSHGPVGPLLRIVPTSGADIDGIKLPAGTSVGVSNVFIHGNDDVFQDAGEFEPRRWLQGSKEDQSELEKHLVAFGRGPRSCTGINFAWAELYIASAMLLRRVQMRPTAHHQDMALTWRDCFLPHLTSPHMSVYCSPITS